MKLLLLTSDFFGLKYLFIGSFGKFAAIITGLYFFKKLSLWYKLVFFQMIIASLCESLGYYIVHQYHQPNAWLFNLYYIPELFLIGIAGGGLAFRNHLNYVLGFLFLGLLIWMLNIFTKGMDITANWSVLYNSLVIVVLYIALLYKSSISSESTLLKQPDMWLSIAFVLYFAMNLPLFGMLNYLVNENMALAKQLFWISHLTNIARQILIAISFYLVGKQASKKVSMRPAS